MKRKSTAIVALTLLLCMLLTSCATQGLPGSSLFSLLGNAINSYINDAANLLCDRTPLISDGKAHYSLSVSDALSDSAKKKAAALAEAICEKTGVQIKNYSTGEERGTIHITKKAVNDQDTHEIIAASYFIGFVGEDLVIRAHSDAMLVAAMRAFAQKLVSGEEANAGDGYLYVSRTLLLEGDTVSLHAGKVPNFVLVRPENAANNILEAVTTLRSTLSFETGSADISIRTEFNSRLEDRIEILIGRLPFEESTAVLNKLEYDSYYIGFHEDTIVINAPSDTLLERAIIDFTTTFVSAPKADASRSEHTLSIPAQLEYTHTFKTCLLTKEAQTNAVLVYPAGAMSSTVTWVKNLAARIKELTGAEIPVMSDAVPLPEGKVEILVGKTNREESTKVSSVLSSNDWRVTVLNGKLVITGASENATQWAIYHFRKALEGICVSADPEWDPYAPQDVLPTLFFPEGYLFTPDDAK